MARSKAGRPPTGIQDRVRLSTFLTPEGRGLLEAVSRALDKPAYLVLEEALWDYLQHLEPGRRGPIEAAAGVLSRRQRKAGGVKGTKGG
jgi:hypothetical protein